MLENQPVLSVESETGLSKAGRLNILIAAAIFLSALFLLWLGSRIELLWSIPLGIAFSFLLLTNYALMHEAAHDIFHADPRINYYCGVVLSWFFPMSFTVFRISHVVHHCCNRTDHEMFDYYYEGDSRIIKFIQWYGLLLGLWWILIPVGNLLLAAHPEILKTYPFRRARSTAVVFDQYGRKETNRLRLEILGLVVFWGCFIWLLNLQWQSVLIFYLFFAFNWSTRQYVTHAFTVRDVTNGALNLSVSTPMRWILLNGHWDLVHHQNPRVSWIDLPSIGRQIEVSCSYLTQYLRLWRGPQLCREPAPEMLQRSSYQAM